MSLPPAVNVAAASLAASSSQLPSLSLIATSRPFTLRHVPKGARNLWSAALSSVLDSIASNPSDTTGWVKLFMLPKCILLSPSEKARFSQFYRDLANTVKSRIRRWNEGDLIGLWSEVLSECSKIQPGKSSTPTSGDDARLRASNARRALQAAEYGEFRKAVQFLSSNGIASPSEESLSEMLQKHPQTSPPSLPSDPSPSPAKVSVQIVSKALQSFPANTSPGPSGLRASHIKEAVGCPSTTFFSATCR